MVNSYQGGVLFKLPTMAERIDIGALDAHFKSVTVLMAEDKEPKKAPDQRPD